MEIENAIRLLTLLTAMFSLARELVKAKSLHDKYKTQHIDKTEERINENQLDETSRKK